MLQIQTPELPQNFLICRDGELDQDYLEAESAALREKAVYEAGQRIIAAVAATPRVVGRVAVAIVRHIEADARGELAY